MPRREPYQLTRMIEITEWITLAPLILLWPVNTPAVPKPPTLRSGFGTA